MTARGTHYWNNGAIPLIAPEILGDIIAQVADLGVVISDTGTVLSILANPAHDTFNRLAHWEGRDIRDTLTIESVPKFESRLATFLQDNAGVHPVELNHADDAGRWEYPVRYSFHRIGPKGAVLLLGRDLRPVAKMQQQLVKAQLSLEREYEAQREYDTRFGVLMDNMTEPVIFVATETGAITDANPAACALADSTRDKMIGRPFATLFEGRKRGNLVDRLIAQAISGRNDGTQTVLRAQGQTVTIIPTLFRTAGERHLLCRISTAQDDGTRADDLIHNTRAANRALATRATPTSDENLRPMVERVGSASLKDIVAETTDAVEKMCIETTLKLTMDNRVAAAEMLGLSRQSLYVKLRKFGLLSRNGKTSH